METPTYFEAHRVGVVDYHQVLSHFKDQARGMSKIKLINTPNTRGGGKPDAHRHKNGFVLLTNKFVGDKKNSKGDIPPVAVVDPTEADRKRALGLFEENEKSNDAIQKKIRDAKRVIDKTETSPQKRTKRAGKKRPAKAAPAAYKSTKKAYIRRKDIFD
jgi:hypothetical protein